MIKKSSILTRQKRDNVNLVTIVVMVLLCFVIWKTAGISFDLSSDIASAPLPLIYQDLARSSSGRANTIDILMWLMFAAIGMMLHFINNTRALSAWTRAWPLVVLLAIVVLSVLWSSVPDIALRRVIRQLLLIAVVAGIVMGASSPRQIVYFAALITGLIMAMNCAAVLIFPAAATNAVGDFEGLHNHKNTAGQVVMLTILIWFAAARWSSGIWTRAALFCGTLIWFLFLLGTNSQTSIIATVTAIIFVISLRYCFRRPVAGIILVVCVLFLSFSTIFALILFNISPSDVVALVEGDKVTLTVSRAKVWEIAYNAFLKHKLLGTGFGSLWLTGALPPVEQYTNLPPTRFLMNLTSAHSGYFDVLATLGIVGSVAFFVFIISFIWTSIRALAAANTGKDGALLAELSAYMVFAALIYNLAQSTFLVFNIIWAFLVLCQLMLCSFRPPTDPQPSSESEPASALIPRWKSFSRIARTNSRVKNNGF